MFDLSVSLYTRREKEYTDTERIKIEHKQKINLVFNLN